MVELPHDNHISGSRSGIAGIYQRHDWAEEKRAALQLLADRIDQLTGDNVKPLRPTAAGAVDGGGPL